MNINELLNIGSETLKKNKISSHLIDSELLLSKTIKKSREFILINSEQKLRKKHYKIQKIHFKKISE